MNRQQAADILGERIQDTERLLQTLIKFQELVCTAKTKQDVARMLFDIYHTSGLEKEVFKAWTKFIDEVVLSDILEKEQ